MAENNSKPVEEEGFKFVDKRHMASDVAPESTTEAGATESPAEHQAAVDSTAQSDPLKTEIGNEDIAAESDGDALFGDEYDGADEGLPGMGGAFGIASYAIGLLSMSAWQFLGLVPDPQTKKTQRELVQARIAIDCVAGMVDALDKAGNAIDAKSMGDLKRVLNDLRLNFVTQSNMARDGK